MGSVGIITIMDRTGNFGNRLQNFALQKVLGALGYDATTIPNTPRLGDGSPIGSKIAVLRKDGLKAFAHKALSLTTPPSPPPPPHPLVIQRLEGNNNFSSTHIQVWPRHYSDIQDTQEFARSFDYFVAGSDQVWNPRFRLLNHVDFLTFADERQRIAYAASIGIDDLLPHEKRQYRRYLRGIPSISVREDRAAEIVHDLTGRRAPVVLDPTMLLPAETWQSLAVAPNDLPPGKYIAKFYLGQEMPREKELIAERARKSGLRVVDLNDTNTPEHYLTSPLEFLGAIKNAGLVIADSYHAAVFSTIFQIPHAIKGRGLMNSRFESLERKTGIHATEWQTQAALDATLDINWDAVSSRLADERREALAFLAQALGVSPLKRS